MPMQFATLFALIFHKKWVKCWESDAPKHLCWKFHGKPMVLRTIALRMCIIWCYQKLRIRIRIISSEKDSHLKKINIGDSLVHTFAIWRLYEYSTVLRTEMSEVGRVEWARRLHLSMSLDGGSFLICFGSRTPVLSLVGRFVGDHRTVLILEVPSSLLFGFNQFQY